jgi:hypothetical protein
MQRRLQIFSQDVEQVLDISCYFQNHTKEIASMQLASDIMNALDQPFKHSNNNN